MSGVVMSQSEPISKRQIVAVMLSFLFWLLVGTDARAATITADEIKAAVTDYVEKNSRWSAENVRVTFLSQVKAEEFPAASPSLAVYGRSREDFIDNTSFTVGFYADRSLLKEKPVNVSIEVLADVLVSVRSLARNQVIKSGDLHVRKRWLKAVPANQVALPEAIGKVLTMTVGANREITKNMLGEPTLIKRGKVVRILFDNDVLKIAALGVSEEAGRRDQVIRVKNLSSNRVIYARVTDGDSVQVDF
jgi:flagella basal body P-ring formation protein FlgA